MRKHWRVIVMVCAFVATATYALSQTNPPIVQWQAIINTINNIQAQLNLLTAQVNNGAGGKSLTFGGTTIPTNTTPPANGATLCNNSNTIGGCSFIGVPWCSIAATSGTTILPNCSLISVDMRADSNLVLPCSSDGQTVAVSVWQDPAFYTSGFTPTFQGCGYPSATYVVGQTPNFPAPAFGSNAVQVYVWLTDLHTRGPYYLFTSPGAQ